MISNALDLRTEKDRSPSESGLSDTKSAELRLLPLGAYVRMDMGGLQRRPLSQQLFVLLAGIAVNFILAAIAWGSFFRCLQSGTGPGESFPPVSTGRMEKRHE